MPTRFGTTLRTSLLCALVLAFAHAQAHQPLLTDDTGTQGTGGNQLEFSYNENQATQAGATTRSRAIPLVYAHGITDTLDLFAQGNEGGTGNPSFGFKWRFYENEESKFSFALKPELRLPLNPKGEAIADVVRTTVGVTGILTRETSFGAVHVNLFASEDHTRDLRDVRGIPAGMGGRIAESRTTTTRLSVAPVWSITDEFKLGLDLGIQHARTAGAITVTNISELGLVYSPNKDFDFAVGITRSVENSAPTRTTTTGILGVTWRFK